MTDIEITSDRARMDVARIHDFLGNESYWARGIPRERVERSIANSLCFGGDLQVGFARVITDYATFAYIADVFVVQTHRGRGIAKRIMQAIAEHPELQSLRRWHLVTRDAHALYAQFGFTPLDAPERHMMRLKMNVAP
jgi:GNAT superfamily N-acetyltransferase